MAVSENELFRIDPVEVPRTGGLLGLCACPGARRSFAPVRDSHGELLHDISGIRDFGARGVVSLVEERELMMLGVHTLPVELRRVGLWWTHLPITDMGIPGDLFEARWEEEGARIRDTLASGEHVVLHCLAGLGRTGTVAARLLIEFGMEPQAAILRVRNSRRGAIQTRGQEKYVLRLKPGEFSPHG